MDRTLVLQRNRITEKTILLLALTVCLIVGPAAGAEVTHLRLESSGLEDLGPGWVYEGWLIEGGMPISTGTFTVAADGAVSQMYFTAEVNDMNQIDAFVLSIEPSPDSDPAPSSVKLLGGDFISGSAHATVAHAAALGDDFSAAAGTYILNAPSGGGAAEYFQGIWWLDPTTGPGPTLSLPALPAGWIYEGWVAGSAGPVSTGRFSSAEGADSDGAGITGGPAAFPPFPGQDFVNPPMDLTDGFAAVISIEPVPDNSSAPFGLKPLIDGMIAALGAGVPQAMSNESVSFPMATATLFDASDQMETAHLRLSLGGLEDLGADFAYEGWLIVDGEAISSGVFTVDGAGEMSQTYFPTQVSDLDAIGAFVLTIEPVPDSDPSPAATHLLGGDVINGRASLSVGHAAAFGDDFSSASGSYILNAPSGGGAADYFNGIWWLDPATGPGPTLVLPMLPDGWAYEGWVAGAEGPVSTGRFTMAEGADNDGAGPDSGQEAFPPFPGQDFVDPAKDLTSGYAAVISVEPEPDNSAAPFAIKPLIDRLVDDVGAGVPQPMGLNLGSLPSGSAALMRTADVLAGANTEGLNNTLWETDLEIHNGSTTATTFTVQLLEAKQANPSPQSMTFELEAFSSVRYPNSMDTLFGFEGTGALRVLVEGDAVKVTSRTFTRSSEGTYGQAIPAHSEDDALAFGEMGRLIQLSYSEASDSGFRTNIGFLNAGMGTVEVNADLYSGDGTFLGTVTVSLEGLEQRQITNAFSMVTNESVDVGYAVVWTDTPGGSFYAYASVVDNQTGDAVFVAVQ